MNDSEQAPIIPEEGEVGFVEYQDFVSKEPFKFASGGKPVSYTHLTLPTI